MHTLKLQVNESIYFQVLSFINQFQSNEISVIEDKVQEDFVVSSTDDVRKRVLNAETHGKYISADTFWLDIDKKIEEM